MSKKFKFTQDDLDKMILDALQQKSEQKPMGKPNLIELLRGKKERQKTWPLT